ncbi:formate dehydrogenase accessory sulfurtransferase FdhD [archaeon SCG-AAA382B04]|nr:formate dehydrogenase accessory sulfurtransferase FdhD [archaeon SCG-AAA382B04]
MLFKKTREEGEKESNIKVPREKPLTIRINGRKLTTAMISPSNKKEFVIGHLLSQGIIGEFDDIASLRIEDNEASVVADNIPFEETKEVLSSGCGAGGFSKDTIKTVDSDYNFSLEEISDSMIEILKAGDTNGVHVAGVFSDNEKFLAKDIGRHNCIDKIIGISELNNLEFDKSYIVSTGRLSSDMVIKCSNVNIPVSTSHKSTTSLAIELAKKSGISLIIYTGKDSSIMSCPEKISY